MEDMVGDPLPEDLLCLWVEAESGAGGATGWRRLRLLDDCHFPPSRNQRVGAAQTRYAAADHHPLWCPLRIHHSPSLSAKFTRRRCCSSPFEPRRLTRKACISLLGSCRSLKQAKEIHCQILMCRLQGNRDVMDDLMVFLTDPQTGDLLYAEKVFESIRNPYLFLCNLMIKSFIKMGLLKSTISLFSRMREEGVSPDNFTYPFVLKASGALQMVPEGRKTHALAVKSGFGFDRYVRNTLIDMYVEMGCVDIARMLFDEMPQRDVVAWNVLIASYVRCKQFSDALAVFQLMQQERVKPDEATLVSTLSACVALRKIGPGREIHRCMVDEFRCSVPLCNALLDLYAKCGNVEMARRFFDHMPDRNVISWTAMVSGYVTSGRLDEARKLFDQSPARDVVLWTAMINGYVQYNHFEEALAMFREMQMRKIKPDNFTVVSLLTVCANLGALEQGKWIHGYIEDNRIRIDAVVGTALIDMYAKCGCIEKSIEIFRRVEGKDTATWTSIICGLAVNGQTMKALEMFEEMKRVGIEPDEVTFIGVLSACSHGGLVGEGLHYFRAMKEVHQIEPKLEHCGCLIYLLGRAGILDESEELLQSMPDRNDENAVPLWGALLAGCKIHGDVEMGERLATRIINKGNGNSGIHTLIANIYAAADRWEDVTRIRRKMKDLGVKKMPGCSSIEVNGVTREFLVGGASYSETDEICRLLNNMSRVMDLEEKVDIEDKLMVMVE